MDKISTMIRNSLTDFQTHLKQYTTDLTERIKRATTKADYGLWTGHFWTKEYGLVPLN